MSMKAAGKCPLCGKDLMVYVMSNGKEYPLPCECQIQKQKADEKRIKEVEQEVTIESNVQNFLKMVGERYKNKTLKNYRKDAEGRDLAHWKLINGMADNFPKFQKHGMGGLVLGSYGCGKTHLEVALGRVLIQKGYRIKMFDAVKLYNKYMSAYSWKLDYSPQDVIEDACDSDLLILDDVGVNNVHTDRDKFAEFFYSLINYRYVQKKPILVSSNLTKADLKAALSPRAVDRLVAMTYIVENKCPSRRPIENRLAK